MSRPCVFFDRDGVINRSPVETRYVLKWEDFEWMPGIVEVLQTVHDKGWPAVVVTSQRGVSLGLMTPAELERVHREMQRELESQGVRFLDIYACTHSEADKHWAKPDPGMMLEAAREHDLDLARSIVIGDADRDIVMGQKAGLAKTIRLKGEKEIGIEADYTCDNLLEVRELLDSNLEAQPQGKIPN